MERDPAQKSVSGLVFAAALDGEGSARPLSWADVQDWDDSRGVLWVHLDRTHKSAQTWLASRPGVDSVVFEALTDDDPRPRSLTIGDRGLVILRGVNLNPGSEPEDMVSLRLWIDQGCLVTLRARRLKAVEDVREQLNRGVGPRTLGDLVAAISRSLIDRAAPVVDALDTRMDAVEHAAAEDAAGMAQTGAGAAGLRRRALQFRRYLAPQREALSRLAADSPSWLAETDRARVREDLDQVTRLVEELDLVRDRAAVMQEELATRAAALLSRRMYTLSLVAVIFLPLTAVIGLMSVEIGGLPGRDVAWAFAALCGVLVLLAVMLTVLLKKMRWL